MAKKLAELRSEGPARPERSLVVVVGEGVRHVAAIMQMQDQLEAAVTRMTTDGGPRKMSEGVPGEVTELRDKIAAEATAMGEYEGTLLIRATRPDGDWRRWCNEHPPRAVDTPGRDRDVELTGWSDGSRSVARCNADALLLDLDTYVVEWEGEPLGEGDFDRLGISGPDQKQIARLVVDMYENEAMSIPFWRRSLSGMQTSANSSLLPSA